MQLLRTMAVFGLVFIALAVWGHQEIVAKQPKDEGVLVRVYDQDSIDSIKAMGVPVRVGDGTVEEHMQEMIDRYYDGEFDILLLRVHPVGLSSSACEDAEACASAIAEACDALGTSTEGGASSVTFNASEKSCSGTCANGQGVDVSCPKND
jgi:hypothetical protein